MQNAETTPDTLARTERFSPIQHTRLLKKIAWHKKCKGFVVKKRPTHPPKKSTCCRGDGFFKKTENTEKIAKYQDFLDRIWTLFGGALHMRVSPSGLCPSSHSQAPTKQKRCIFDVEENKFLKSQNPLLPTQDSHKSMPPASNPGSQAGKKTQSWGC